VIASATGVEEDAELYRAWRGGDAGAGRRLIERHYDGIARFFRSKAGPSADDLVQRVFLVAADPRGGFRGESSFRTYLFGVARNVLFDHYRELGRDSRRDVDVSVSSVHDLFPGMSTMAAQRADLHVLYEALQRIPIDIQMTLELFYWEDLGVAELAVALDIPEGTVKSRLYRGRMLLEQAIAKVPASPDAQASVRAVFSEWVERMRKAIGDQR
jgi:RNA polymerase sigma factor (sigma-70 family)